MPGHDHVAVVPQLAVALNCLPSQILKEDYNDIRNVIAVFGAQAKKQKAESNRMKRT